MIAISRSTTTNVYCLYIRIYVRMYICMIRFLCIVLCDEGFVCLSPQPLSIVQETLYIYPSAPCAFPALCSLLLRPPFFWGGPCWSCLPFVRDHRPGSASLPGFDEDDLNATRTYWEPSVAPVGLVSPEMVKLKVGELNF